MRKKGGKISQKPSEAKQAARTFRPDKGKVPLPALPRSEEAKKQFRNFWKIPELPYRVERTNYYFLKMFAFSKMVFFFLWLPP